MDAPESTTSPRAKRVRRILSQWQHSGLTLHQFAAKRGIPPSTLAWWLHAFRRDAADVAASGLALFTRDELERIRKMPDAMARAVCAAKRAFPGSTIVD